MQEFLARFMPENASAHGPRLDQLTAWVHWLMLILFIGWGAYFVYVLFRFRAGAHPKAVHAGAKGKTAKMIEIGVAGVEAVLLIAFAVPTWSKWITPPKDSDNPLRVRVVAEQFAWNIHYPGGDDIFGRTDVTLVDASNPLGIDLRDPNAKDDIITVNQLHLEVNRPVAIALSSKDVIHSFGLPQMRVKQDAIPGQEIPVYFTPVKTSGRKRWEINCAQLCGLGHYRMRGFYHVHEKAAFETWLQQNAPVAAASAL
jgi:cytochrome c oxidase subunit II